MNILDLKKHLKQEATYIGRGAKLLPKLAAKKIAASGKAWWEQQKEIGRQQRLAELKARKKKDYKAKKQDSSFNVNGIVEVLLGSPDKDED